MKSEKGGKSGKGGGFRFPHFALFTHPSHSSHIMEKLHKTLAIVLNKKEWREDDLLFSFYTKEFGKITATATAGRKIKSKLAGQLNALGILEIIFVRGRTQNKITHAYLSEQWRFDDVESLNYASCILEILNRAMADELKNEKIWRIAAWALPRVLRAKEVEQKKFILNIFIVKLLFSLGYQINLKQKNNLSVKNRDLVEKLQQNDSSVDLQISPTDNQALFLFVKEYLQSMIEQGIKSFNSI